MKIKQLITTMKKDALLSADGRYRHWLLREWNPTLGKVMFIGLNPSTADASDDDPTIRRCIGFVKEWGYGGFYMVNLFDYRATDPAKLRSSQIQNVSSQNESAIQYCEKESDIVVLAWGTTHFKLSAMFMRRLFPDAYCLGVTKLGQPRRPLFLKKDAILTLYAPIAEQYSLF